MNASSASHADRTTRKRIATISRTVTARRIAAAAFIAISRGRGAFADRGAPVAGRRLVGEGIDTLLLEPPDHADEEAATIAEERRIVSFEPVAGELEAPADGEEP